MLRFFIAPTASYRLFDPMPLPRAGRIKHRGRTRAPKNRITFTTLNFDRKVKKIPVNK